MDQHGVMLDVDAPPGAELTFFRDVMSFRVPLDDIGYEPHYVPGGGVNIRVQVSEVSSQSKDWSARFAFIDEEIPSGCNPLLGACASVEWWPGLVESDLREPLRVGSAPRRLASLF